MPLKMPPQPFPSREHHHTLDGPPPHPKGLILLQAKDEEIWEQEP